MGDRHSEPHRSLSSGDRIGPYEVVARVGAGGMGEVYRARDDRLRRDVALKIVSPRFGLDPTRLARFAREAQILATLNHPNVATLYGLEEARGFAGVGPRIRRRRNPRGSTCLAAHRSSRPGGSRPRAADGGRARSCARERHRPPGSEACQYRGTSGWLGQAARLWSGPNPLTAGVIRARSFAFLASTG